MSLLTIFAIYLTIWWTVLFAILPLGTTTYAEAGIKVTDGGDPGAPIDPKLKRKCFTTTWISAIVLALILAVIHFHMVDLSRLPWRT
jgi:predicted secreted protein